MEVLVWVFVLLPAIVLLVYIHTKERKLQRNVENAERQSRAIIAMERIAYIGKLRGLLRECHEKLSDIDNFYGVASLQQRIESVINIKQEIKHEL